MLQVQQQAPPVQRGGSARAQRVVVLLLRVVLGRCHGAPVLRQGWGEEAAGVRRLPEGGEEQEEGEGVPSQEVTRSYVCIMRCLW